MTQLDELKSKAYDALVQVEVWSKNLKELSKAIAEYKEETIESVEPIEQVKQEDIKEIK